MFLNGPDYVLLKFVAKADIPSYFRRDVYKGLPFHLAKTGNFLRKSFTNTKVKSFCARRAFYMIGTAKTPGFWSSYTTQPEGERRSRGSQRSHPHHTGHHRILKSCFIGLVTKQRGAQFSSFNQDPLLTFCHILCSVLILHTQCSYNSK